MQCLKPQNCVIYEYTSTSWIFCNAQDVSPSMFEGGQIWLRAGSTRKKAASQFSQSMPFFAHLSKVIDVAGFGI